MSDLGYNQAVTLPETNIPRLGDVQTLRQPLSYETARAFRSPASYKAAKAAVLNTSLNVALSPPLDIFRSTPCQKNESDLVINAIHTLSGLNHQSTVWQLHFLISGFPAAVNRTQQGSDAR
jgi:hypothetical protein